MSITYGFSSALEGGLPGESIPTAPLVPHTFPASALEKYINGCTAPSAPSISQVASPDSSPLPGALDYWKHHRLHQLASLHHLCVSRRIGSSYHLTDTLDTTLYIAAIDMKNICYCCGKSPRGPGVNFQVMNATSDLILTINLAREGFFFSDTLLKTSVKMASGTSLGIVEGRGSKFTVRNLSGDDVCYVHMEEECCRCQTSPYLIVPAGDTSDTGLIVPYKDGYLITFPRVLDVPARALLLSSVISLQYHTEDLKGAL